jgi:hypothetical protein
MCGGNNPHVTRPLSKVKGFPRPAPNRSLECRNGNPGAWSASMTNRPDPPLFDDETAHHLDVALVRQRLIRQRYPEAFDAEGASRDIAL